MDPEKGAFRSVEEEGSRECIVSLLEVIIAAPRFGSIGRRDGRPANAQRKMAR